MNLNEFKNKYLNDKVELTLRQTIKIKILLLIELEVIYKLVFILLLVYN